MPAPYNVLLVIGDDMGMEQFSEEGLSGASPGYPFMPNIQDIGNRGIKYTRFYSTAFCSPTRACTFTGRYALRTGLGDIVESDDDEPLFEGEFTLPELIKEYTAGLYSTAIVGKYHLGNAQNGGLFAPNFQGWDYSCVTVRNLVDEPDLFPTNTHYHALYNFDYSVNGEERRNVATYCGTWATNNALDWIKRQGTRPWFCVVSYHMPHEPHGRPPLTHFDTGVWNCPDLEPPSQTGADIIPYFKAACEALDYEFLQLWEGIGQYSGDVRDNTVVIFLPDNGTDGAELGNETYADDTPIPADHGKRTCYELGINVPLYIDGPHDDLLMGDAGQVVTGLVGAVDLFGFIAEVCGVQNVAQYMLRRKGVTIDSSSFYSTLSGVTTTARTSVLSEIFSPNGVEGSADKIGQRAMISDNWKLYRRATTATGPAEFYRRDFDPKEENDLLAGGGVAGLQPEELAAYNELNDAMAELYASVE